MSKKFKSLTNLNFVTNENQNVGLLTGRNKILHSQFKKQTDKMEENKDKYMKSITNSRSINPRKNSNTETLKIKNKSNMADRNKDQKLKFKSNENLNNSSENDSSYSIFRPLSARSDNSDEFKVNTHQLQNDSSSFFDHDSIMPNSSIQNLSDDLNWIDDLQVLDVDHLTQTDENKNIFNSNHELSKTMRVLKDNQINKSMEYEDLKSDINSIKNNNLLKSEDVDSIPEDIQYLSSSESTTNSFNIQTILFDQDVNSNKTFGEENNISLDLPPSNARNSILTTRSVKSPIIKNHNHNNFDPNLRLSMSMKKNKINDKNHNLTERFHDKNKNNNPTTFQLQKSSKKNNEKSNSNIIKAQTSIEHPEFYKDSDIDLKSCVETVQDLKSSISSDKISKKDLSTEVAIKKRSFKENAVQSSYSSSFDVSLQKLSKIEKSLLSINNILSIEQKPELVESPYFKDLSRNKPKINNKLFDPNLGLNFKKPRNLKYTREMAASILQKSIKHHLLSKRIDNIIETERKNSLNINSENVLRVVPNKKVIDNTKPRKQVLQERKEAEKEREKKVAEEEITSLLAAGKISQNNSRAKTPMQKTSVASRLIANLNQLDENASKVDSSVFPVSKVTTVDDVFDVLKHLEGSFSADITNETINLLNNWNSDDPSQPASHISNLQTEILTNFDLINNENINDNKMKEFIDFLENGGELNDWDQFIVNGSFKANKKQVAESKEFNKQSSSNLEERNLSIQQLKNALESQRRSDDHQMRDLEGELTMKLDEQKKHFEGAITRHLAFIDQLIEDKRQLTESLEALQKKFTSVTNHLQNELSTKQQTHQIELKKIKDMHLANEHLKRERWMKNEAKKIKELTMKGFEPELARLMSQHKTDIAKLNHLHEEEKMAWEDAAAKRYARMLEDVRLQMAQDTDAACARERSMAKQSYDKQLEQDRKLIEEQRRRLYEEVREEKDRLMQESNRYRQESDDLHLKLKEAHRTTGDILKKEYEAARNELELRHQAEVRSLKDQIVSERDKFEQEFINRQEKFLLTKEREMKEKLRKETDKEIDEAVRNAYETKHGEMEFLKKEHEAQIKKLKEKFENEIQGLETSEKQVSDKYNQIKASLLDAEGEIEKMKVIIKQKETEIVETKSLLEVRNKERDGLTEILRREIYDKMVSLEVDNERLKKEAVDANAKHRLEVERLKNQHELQLSAKQVELEEVHRRVKEAIQKRNKIEEDLKQQRDAAIKRADYIQEQMLELKNVPPPAKPSSKKNSDLKPSPILSNRPK